MVSVDDDVCVCKKNKKVFDRSHVQTEMMKILIKKKKGFFMIAVCVD